LGNRYHNGEGVERDYRKAVYWLSKAAEQGNAGAQYELGICYFLGNGVVKDHKKAVYWLNKAAAQGVQIPKVMLDVINN
ncbi:MAG: sel1 repeat family protein, partial [Clostridia bacterium]|nr:sel1 repeat family protein [Clostridia bacterium]